MKEKSKIDKYCLAVMAAAAAAGLVLAFFVCRSGALRMQVVHSCATTNQTFQTGPLSGPRMAVQQFVPQYDTLKSLQIIINRQGDTAVEGGIRITIFDEEGNIYAEAVRTVAELASDSYEEFELNAGLKAGGIYFFSVETINAGDVAPVLVYRPMQLDRIEENKALSYDGEVVAEASAACRYVYALPLTKLQICTYTAFCLLLAMFPGSVACLILRRIGK